MIHLHQYEKGKNSFSKNEKFLAYSDYKFIKGPIQFLDKYAPRAIHIISMINPSHKTILFNHEFDIDIAALQFYEYGD